MRGPLVNCSEFAVDVRLLVPSHMAELRAPKAFNSLWRFQRLDPAK